jgi:hypothetical protein
MRKIERGGVSMKVKGVFVVILSFLLLYVPVAPISAASVAGKMITKGTAEINGVAAPAVTSVFVGDRIATQKEATTSLSFAGGDAIVMPELAKAGLGWSEGHFIVNLDEGTVSVLNKTQTPIMVETHGTRIFAASGQPALFDVTISGNLLRVVARGGVARVETPTRTADVPPGNEIDATLVPPNPPNPPQPQSAGSSSAGTWLLIGAVVIASTALVVGAVALNKVENCTVSPSSNAVSC